MAGLAPYASWHFRSARPVLGSHCTSDRTSGDALDSGCSYHKCARPVLSARTARVLAPGQARTVTVGAHAKRVHCSSARTVRRAFCSSAPTIEVRALSNARTIEALALLTL